MGHDESTVLPFVGSTSVSVSVSVCVCALELMLGPWALAQAVCGAVPKPS